VKIFLASLVALICGILLGWRPVPLAENGGEAISKSDRKLQVATASLSEADDEEWASWRERIKKAGTAGELEALYQEILKLKSGPERAGVSIFLQARWAKVDPAGAMNFFNHQDQWEWRGGILCEWIRKDFEEGLAGLELVDETQVEFTEKAVMAELLKRGEPDLGLRFLKVTGSFIGNYSIWDTVWRKFAEDRTEELLEVFEEFSDKAEAASLERVVGDLAGVMAGDDPAAAIAWCRGLPEEIQYKALEGALSSWGRSDPKAVISQLAEWAKNGSGPEEKVRLRLERGLENGLIDSLVDHDFAAALKWQSEVGGYGSRLGETVAGKWRAGELSLAEIYGEVVGTDGAYKYRVGGLFFDELWKGAGRRSLDEIWTFLRGQPEGQVRSYAMSDLWMNAFRHRSMEAAQIISAMAAGPERDEITRNLTVSVNEEWFHGDFLEALPLEVRAAGVSALYAKAERARSNGDYYYPVHPGAVVEGLSEVKDAELREEVMAGVGLRWGEIDPVGALAWTETLAGEDRVIATREVAWGWAAADAGGMATSLAGRPEGAAKDLLIVGLTEELSRDDPEGAWLWSGAIGEEKLGEETRARAFESWIEIDETAARSALESAEIGANEREALRAILK
jgi:hypothetical protein